MNWKRSVVIGAVILALGVTVSAAPRKGKASQPQMSADLVTDAFFGANKIFSYVTNDGGFARDFVGELNLAGGGGMVFPYISLEQIGTGLANKTCVFAAGIWMGAEDAANGDTLICMSEFSSEFVPGPMAGGTFTPDDVRFRTYSLYRDSLENNPNDDYLNWPVGDGAPVDSTGKPAILGDQMLWSVFNDADPAGHGNDAGGTAPMGVEVQQTTFGFDRAGPLGQIMFLKYKIINKGDKTLNNMYISIWSDPDLGDAGDDLVGCDTTLSVGYVYNAADDNVYGSNPPCVGVDFFQGPLFFTGDPADTAIMWGQYWEGYLNLPLVSFNKYINGTDPDGPNETYFYMNGLDKNGNPVIDPTTSQPTNFFGSGDPVNGTGFLDTDESDRRFMLSTGPITFAPGDSTEIVAGVVIGQGTDRLTSITEMKKIDETAQKIFDLFFKTAQPPAAPVVTVAEDENGIALSWTDTSEVDTGDWPFEGYAVYEGETPTGPFKLLATYDVIDSLFTVYSFEIDPLTNDTVLIPEVFGTNAGVKRFYFADKTSFGGGKLVNYQNYYYRVDAYSVHPWYHMRDTLDPVLRADSLPPNPVVVGQGKVQIVTPRNITTGMTLAGGIEDTLPVNHPSGISDGIIGPIVVDPYNMSGNSYSVEFYEDTTIDNSVSPPDTTIELLWRFINTTMADTILAARSDQDGNQNGLIYDGFLLTVSGPPLEGKDYEYESASPLNISPVAAADNDYEGGDRWFTGGSHGGELLFGGVFMEPNFWGATTLDPATDYKIVEVRFRPMESYTDLNGDGEFTIGEPYTVDDPAQTQKAFMYQTFSGAAYEGFYDVPFTAWDVSDPNNPRQLNIVVRDRDANFEWSLHANTGDPALPNGGDQQFNYTWILNTDYDPTGTMYGDGTGGTIDFFGAPGGAVYDGMWVLWLDERGSSRGMLAEECTLRLIPNFVNTSSDVFTFTATAPALASSVSEGELAAVKAVPNPYYLFSSYEPDQFQREMKFTHLPMKCTIRIFSLSGELVRTLEKDDDLSYTAWDLTTESRLPVASGIYIYLVTTDTGSEKIGKIAVFTEAEQLQSF